MNVPVPIESVGAPEGDCDHGRLGTPGGLVVAGWGVAKSVRVIPLRTVQTLVDNDKWVAQ